MSSEGSDKIGALSGYHYGIAGAATGTLTRFLVQPLDVLKITFQLQITPKELKKSAKYTSLLQALNLIYREEGVKGLWKGHIPAQFLSVIFGAVQFSSYEMLTTYFYSSHPLHYTSSEHFVNICCGSIAGLAATILSFPFDIIKTHLVFQGGAKVYRGTFHTATKLYQIDGPRAFTKGLAAACIQTVPSSGLVFCFHGVFAQVWFVFFQELKHESNMSTTGSITTGLLAGLCAKTMVYPFDLMKKRLQIQSLASQLPSSKEILVCKSISECFMLTIKNEGISGLFKGFTPTLIKSGATTSLYFTIYDKVIQLLQYSIMKR